MQEAVLYTGTFNPYHLGHLWQLERTYRAHPFDRAVIAIITSNPKKPNIPSCTDRMELINLMLRSKKLPFEVELHPIDYVQPNNLKHFTYMYLQGYHVVRTVASDVIVEFALDEQYGFKEALLLYHYVIIVRPLVGRKELEDAIARLPKEIGDHFSYQIAYIQTEDYISATNIRKDVRTALCKGYITQEQSEFIQRKHLYG